MTQILEAFFKTTLTAVMGVMFFYVTSAQARSVPVTNDNIAHALKSYRAVSVTPEERTALTEWHKQHQDAPAFVDIGWLRASQNRLSFDRVRTKADEVFASKKIRWNGRGVENPLPNQKGKSLFAKADAIPVVIMPDGSLAIVDGHHEVGVALLSGSKKMPVKIIDDLSKKFETNAEAWKHLESQDLAYFSNLDGTFSEKPVDYNELQNDPNRMWLALTARRVELETSADGNVALDTKMSLFDLWVKVGKGIPFIEFMLADILYKHNLVYRADMTHRELLELLDKSRQAFAAEIKAGSKLFEKLAFISQPVNKAEVGHDPNLALAKLITGAIKTKEITWHKGDPDDLIALATKKDHVAAWAEIAYLLYQSAIVYEKNNSDSLDPQLRERIRQVLIAAKKASNKPGAVPCNFSVVKKTLLPQQIAQSSGAKAAMKRKSLCKADLII